MIRESKALGLALAAMLAMGALAASAAQATTTPLQATAGSYPALMTGNPIKHKEGEKEPFQQSFTTSGGAVFGCSKYSFVSTISAATENLTVIPKYEECSVKIGAETLPATVTMEDCDYVNHGAVTEEPNSHNFKEGTVDLVCPAGKTIVIHFYKNAAEHAVNKSLCTLKVAPFTNKGENTFINETGTPDSVTVKSTLTNIAVTREGSLFCGAANMTATYTGTTTVKAFQDLGSKTPENGTLSEIKEGAQINLTVSETP